MNFNDDSVYFTYEFEDECSQFTAGAYWVNGGEYYACVSRCRIPIAIKDDLDAIDQFIDSHTGKEGFFV